MDKGYLLAGWHWAERYSTAMMTAVNTYYGAANSTDLLPNYPAVLYEPDLYKTLLYLGTHFDPDHLTLYEWRQVFPFAYNIKMLEQFELLVVSDYLGRDKDNLNQYFVTQNGRRLIHDYYARLNEASAQFNDFPTEKLEQAIAICEQLIDEILSQPMSPAYHLVGLRTIYAQLAPDCATLWLKLYEQQLHISAYVHGLHGFLKQWQQFNIHSFTWMAFFWLADGWGNSVDTLASSTRLMSSHPFSHYQMALAELEELHWVEKTAGIYTLTTTGQAIFVAACKEFNHCISIPWQQLNPELFLDLDTLMQEITCHLAPVDLYRALPAS